jgi:hypothetical protein
MRNHGRFLLGRAPALWALLLAYGCQLPGTMGVSTEPGPGRPPPGADKLPAARANVPTGPVTGPGPAPILPLNLQQLESPQDQLSQLSQQLKDCEDVRKLLAARALQLEKTVQEKDAALAEASDDITKTEEEIARTRTDIRRVKQENADLRDKLDKSQHEVIDLRKQMIKMMEKDAASSETGPGKEP